MGCVCKTLIWRELGMSVELWHCVWALNVFMGTGAERCHMAGLGHLLSWLQSCCEEEAGKVGGEQAMEVQKALCLTVSQLEVWRFKCVSSVVTRGRHRRTLCLRKQIITQWLAGCHLCYCGEADVYSGHQFIHGFIIFLYLHLIMGVSGNLVIGFTWNK